ncbi:Pc22g26330 [Penicillium rubens Wisconsin 54-1255]|jgi:hypothetical protein|uniref:Pc22g26330 protein n=1 Tax=Penicillium rubens (strain ATCC 28089 / DSM 1075 / NRRL 1951 / Wisconsin 54-1255) TaxID=500485 RepID=B6HTU0_PENRW|nr:Pc22g26330 [Penicillium rubens Wisconsin 54-1255]
MFGIQFDAAGIYLVGTPTEQFHISFEELISFTGGIIGLLEYGVTWKVLKGVSNRLRHRLVHQSGTSSDTQPSLWVDNSGPVLYGIRHGPHGIESIRASPQELEGSRFGRAVKKHWDRGMIGLSSIWTTRMLMEAFFVGLWRNTLRRVKTRKS